MKKNILFFLFTFIFIKSSFSQATCDVAVPFCNSFGSPATVVSGGSAETGPDYGCLDTQPNPSWSLLKIETAGTLQFQISQVTAGGAGIDVDFICYGPFNDPITPCQTGQLTAANTIACSFSSNAVENFTILNAQVGEYYLILITNYEGLDGTLTFQQTNAGQAGSGESDCSIVCTIELEEDKTFCLSYNHTLTTTLGNSSIANNATYKWFKNNIEILGETTNELILTPSNTPTTDTYKVELDSADCDDISFDEIEIIYADPFSNFNLMTITDLLICDTDNDEFAQFNLTDNQAAIANTENPLDYTFTYFSDAALTTQINTPTTYTNTINNTQTIYLSIIHNTFIGCTTNSSFTINVAKTPTANTITNWFACDNDLDGFLVFDFNTLNNQILNGQDNSIYTITYHNTQAEADTNQNPLVNYTNATANTLETIFVRIENTNFTTCFDTNQFDINVINQPTANPILDWIVCDDNNDGFTEFDLETLNPQVLNGQNASTFTISYHKTQVDADTNTSVLLLLYTNEFSFTEETIFVRIENQNNINCFDTNSFKINTIQTPIFDVVDTKYICVNLLPQDVLFQIENPQGTYTYSWKDTLGIELSNQPIFTATIDGDYSITATTTDGNMCETTKTIHLLPAEPATITDFTINEYWIDNNFSLNIEVTGTGLYEYALDNSSGPFQEEAYFFNIAPGIHEVFIREKNNCGMISKMIDIFGYASFFTPNNDGVNDTWKVQGIKFKPSAKIYIFDRFGKLITGFTPALNQGWNGTFKNKKAPEADYWFTAEMVDYKGNDIIRTGNFSLKR